MKNRFSLGTAALSVALISGSPILALAEQSPKSASTETSITSAEASAAPAKNELPAQGKYLLIMTLGYLGGQPGAFLSKPGSAAVDAVMIKFNSMSQCEYVQTQMQSKWRTDIFNSICIALPDGAEVIG